ncbi:MAG: ROK family protein [Pseudomonadota bacterium]
MPKESCALSVDLGGTNLRGAVVDRDGSILIRREVGSSKGGTADLAVEQISSFCADLIQESRKSRIRIEGVGLGLAGFLVGRTRMQFSPNLPHLLGVDIGTQVSKAVGLPCISENDGNCAALGEWWIGSARGHRNAIVLTLGTGVGGGIISDGILLRGSRGAGAEVGHVCVDPSGPPCGCGSNGCLEVFASGGAFARETGIPGNRLFDEARHGDETALSAFRRFGRYLGIGISSFCFLFDPEIIVLGGKVARSAQFFLPDTRSEIGRRLRNHPSRNTPIVVGTQLDDAGLLGAAWLVLNRA